MLALCTYLSRISLPIALGVALLAGTAAPTAQLLDGSGILAWPSGLWLPLLFVLGGRAFAPALVAAWCVHRLRLDDSVWAAQLALVDVSAAALSAALLRRSDLRSSLARLYDVLLLTLAGALATGVAAGALVLFGLLVAQGMPVSHTPWAPFVLAHALGVLGVAPFLLVWAQPVQQGKMAQVLGFEALLLLVALMCSAATVAAVWGAERSAQTPALLFFVMPVLLWAATRFGQRGAVTALLALLLACFCCSVTMPDAGHLLRGDPLTPSRAEELVAWQTYLGGALLGLLILGSIVEERRAAMRLRDEFLLVASHELKTPLTALMLGVENLERRMQRQPTADASAYLRKLNNCQAQIDKLARLVDGLLDLSHYGEKQMRLQRQHHNLQQLLGQVVNSMAPQAAQVHCSVACSTPVAVWGCYDATRLEQLLCILLDNACKYGAGQPIKLSLVADAHHARIIVEDGGIGIAAEDLRRIFEQFERAVSARSYGGLGLGLFVARKIAVAHGGELWAERVPHHGARFVVRLPRDADDHLYEGPI